MRVIAVDDEQLALQNLSLILKRFSDINELNTFCIPSKAIEWLAHHHADVAFLDINMQKMDGLTLAKQIKERMPNCAVIFVTGYCEYAVQAFEIHASGYLMKPVRPEAVRRELDHILDPLAPCGAGNNLRIQCFGNFEVFAKGIPVKFKRSKTKELLAYLVDRRGASVNTGELCAILWENQEDTVSRRSQLRTLMADLTRTLKSIGAEHILIKRRNSFSIDANQVNCDYYGFLKKDTAAVNSYTGEYMTQYSWAEMTLGLMR